MNVLSIGGGQKEPILREAIGDFDNPEVLIIPSSCSTETAYERKVGNCIKLFDRLGLPNVVLHGYAETPTETQIDQSFGRANVLYVIGGNAPYMMRTLAAQGTDQTIKETVGNGALLSGTSAGALLPFKMGYSCPAVAPAKEEWEYAFIPGLDLLDAAVTTHADKRDPAPAGELPENRLRYFSADIPEGVLGIGLDNSAALYIRGGSGRILRSAPGAEVYVIDPAAENGTAAPIQDSDYLDNVVSRIAR